MPGFPDDGPKSREDHFEYAATIDFLLKQMDALGSPSSSYAGRHRLATDEEMHELIAPLQEYPEELDESDDDPDAEEKEASKITRKILAVVGIVVLFSAYLLGAFHL